MQPLHIVAHNYSFASSDNGIVRSSQQKGNKVKYLIQFGIALNVKNYLINESWRALFFFKFIESITSQIKKQY